jgi:L-alanine-DL-glutamate epimerase-like enolase superfamily enzyme
MSKLDVTVAVETWPFRKPFRISGNVWSESRSLLVNLDDGINVGRGEAQGVYYRNETPESLIDQIAAVQSEVEAGIDRETLRALLPAGGARNALDCAIWELESRRSGRPIWALAGLEPVRPLVSTWTIGADAPDQMARDAIGYAAAKAIKLKLTGDGLDGDRVRAVRAARPDVWLGVDANQGLDRARLEALLPIFVDADVSLIEQPVPVGEDAALDGLQSPIPLAADESVQGLDDMAALQGRYDVVNIKLDKCGGLTEGLAMARAAADFGLKVMVGNMCGTSLAMAPSFVLGQLCDVVDLDGPLLLARDRSSPVTYRNGLIEVPDGLWGAPQNQEIHA